jgi:tetratricopeptide (TPR) repeat protein
MQAPAADSPDTSNRIEALHALGVALGYMGRFAEGREYLQRIFDAYDPHTHPYHASVYVLDPIITSQCMMARFLVVMGHPDAAVRFADEAAQRATRLVHPQSLAYATFFQAWIRHDRGEVDSVLALSEAAMAQSKEQGLHQIREWARAARGWALCTQGRLRDGVEEIRRSLDLQEKMHSALERPYCLALLARGLAQQGQHAEAVKSMDEALALIEANEERIYEAEIHRLRGDVFLARALEDEVTVGREHSQGAPIARPRPDDPLIAQARASYERAIELARRSGAHMHELTAAVSLFRLWQRLGDSRGARDAVVDACARLGEANEAPYVAEARRLVAPA